MKSSKFSESQIIKALKENEQGRSSGIYLAKIEFKDKSVKRLEKLVID